MKYVTEWKKNEFEVTQENCIVTFKFLNGTFHNWENILKRDVSNHLDRMFLKDIDKKYNLNIQFN